MAKRFRNAIGPQMRKLRFNRDWTQDQLAAKLQLAGLEFDRVAVAKIESQIRSVYDFEVVVIAQVLGVTPVDLLPSFSELNSDLIDLIAGKQES